MMLGPIARWAATIGFAAWFFSSASATKIAHLRNGFSIRHEHRQFLGDNTRLFTAADSTSYIDVPTADITGFENDPAPVPVPQSAPPTSRTADLNKVVRSASAVSHLDPDLVNSVIHAESGFHTNAVSRKGAQGLMQLMPETAGHLGVTNPFDPQDNVSGGTRYLRQLLEQYNFDLIKALAAYNAGPQRVEQFHGVPPYRETRAYVARVVHDYNKKVAAQKRTSPANSTNARPVTKKKIASSPSSSSATAPRD
jgi:soluble lytic murein transglycosylase-like protein